MALKDFTALLYLLVSLIGIALAADLDPLYVDKTKISVSGISSGGAMAIQFHVAFSKEIMGVGSLAGIPYLCQVVLSCMQTPSFIMVSSLWLKTSSAYLYSNVDNPSYMGKDRVWIFAGTEDSVVNPGVASKIQSYYTHYVNSNSQVKLVNSIKAEHGQITNNYGSACDTLNHQDYLNNCDYSASYELLNHIYGGVLQKPNSTYVAKGELRLFDQTKYTTYSAKMEDYGYVYIPTGCKDRTTECKLHIAFHGCMMGRSRIGDAYVKHAGYNEVGELNNIIILYPQVGTSAFNPNGCWDWWGYTSTLYFAFKSGPQMAAVHRMMDKIA